jgi:hypothetical protein
MVCNWGKIEADRKWADTHRSSFNRIVATINIIPHEQIVGVRALQNKNICELKTRNRGQRKKTNKTHGQYQLQPLYRSSDRERDTCAERERAPLTFPPIRKSSARS